MYRYTYYLKLCTLSIANIYCSHIVSGKCFSCYHCAMIVPMYMGFALFLCVILFWFSVSKLIFSPSLSVTTKFDTPGQSPRVSKALEFSEFTDMACVSVYCPWTHCDKLQAGCNVVVSVILGIWLVNVGQAWYLIWVAISKAALAPTTVSWPSYIIRALWAQCTIVPMTCLQISCVCVWDAKILKRSLQLAKCDKLIMTLHHEYITLLIIHVPTPTTI